MQNQPSCLSGNAVEGGIAHGRENEDVHDCSVSTEILLDFFFCGPETESKRDEFKAHFSACQQCKWKLQAIENAWKEERKTREKAAHSVGATNAEAF